MVGLGSQLEDCGSKPGSLIRPGTMDLWGRPWIFGLDDLRKEVKGELDLSLKWGKESW